MQISISLGIWVHVHATDTLIEIVNNCPSEPLASGEMPNVPPHVLAVACQIQRTVEWRPPVPRKTPGGTNVVKRSRPPAKVGFGVLLTDRLEAEHPTRGVHRLRFGNCEVDGNKWAAVCSRELLNRESFILNVVVHQTSL